MRTIIILFGTYQKYLNKCAAQFCKEYININKDQLIAKYSTFTRLMRTIIILFGTYQKYLNKCAGQFCKESWGWTGSSLGTGDTAGEHNPATKQII